MQKANRKSLGYIIREKKNHFNKRGEKTITKGEG